MDQAETAPARRRIDLRWTKRRKRRFLTRLAETYDMAQACAAAGLDWAIMCRLRAEDPAFAAEWAAVIAAGYDRIEAMLLRQAGAGESKGAGDVALARELLKQRGPRKAGDAALPPAAPRVSREQRIASIMRKLTAPPAGAAGPKDGWNGAAPLDGLAGEAARAGPG